MCILPFVPVVSVWSVDTLSQGWKIFSMMIETESNPQKKVQPFNQQFCQLEQIRKNAWIYPDMFDVIISEMN